MGLRNEGHCIIKLVDRRIDFLEIERLQWIYFVDEMVRYFRKLQVSRFMFDFMYYLDLRT